MDSREVSGCNGKNIIIKRQCLEYRYDAQRKGEISVDWSSGGQRWEPFNGQWANTEGGHKQVINIWEEMF